MEYPVWFVCLMGMGTVFAGLIILIVAVTIMGSAAGGKGKKTAPEPGMAGAIGKSCESAGPSEETAKVLKGVPKDFDKDLLAAISAAIVADMGEGVETIRITSLKEVE